MMPMPSQNEIKELIKGHVVEYVQIKAGPLAGELLGSKANACALLTNESAIIRMCAIDCCFHLWKCGADSDFQTHCISAIADDSDLYVRRTAIRICDTLFCGSKRRDLQQVLATIITDERLFQELRWVAYTALWNVEFGNIDGIVEHFINNADAARNGNPPSLEKVDWSFVRGFANRGAEMGAGQEEVEKEVEKGSGFNIKE